MISLLCTRKVVQRLQLKPAPTTPLSSSKLGDWCVNVIPTAAGELFVFVNERSLCAVAVPPREVPELITLFVRRVANLLSMLGVPDNVIEAELTHMDDIRIGKATNRRVLGCANEIAFELQLLAEDASPDQPLSLSDAELRLSEMPHSPLPKLPRRIALELLAASGRAA